MKNPFKSEFHYFSFNGQKCRLERVERKTILRAETEDEDIPICLMRTKRGIVLCAKGNEDSSNDSGEKVNLTFRLDYSIFNTSTLGCDCSSENHEFFGDVWLLESLALLMYYI